MVGLYTDQTNNAHKRWRERHMAQTLHEEYVSWVHGQCLDPEADAVELLMFKEGLTIEQRAWLQSFCIKWDRATPEEQWGPGDPTQAFKDADQDILRYAR
jgi:hypothetical protein